MTIPRWRTRLLSGAAIGTWFALFLSTAFAASPTWNRDVAGTPGHPVDSDPSTLAITVRTCPAGYDPTNERADYVRECREPAGDTSFQLSFGGSAGPSASTGTSGDSPQQSTVQFSNLTPGTHMIMATAPAEIGAGFIGRCSSDKRSFEDYPFAPFATPVDGILAVKLVAGETLACDWFQVKTGATS